MPLLGSNISGPVESCVSGCVHPLQQQQQQQQQPSSDLASCVTSGQSITASLPLIKSMDSSDRNEPTVTAPSRLSPSSDVYLHFMLQRYQDYYDQINMQARLEREVVQMRNCISTGVSVVTDDISDPVPQPQLLLSSSSSSPSSTRDRSRLRARYAERTPSVSREPSGTGRPARRTAREGRKVRFGFGIEPVVGMPCFMVPARAGRAAGLSEVDLAAINFILALENPCWDHFRRHDFHHSCRPDSDDTEHDNESGHLMMASALCLASASAAVFAQLDDVALAGAGQDVIGSRSAISWEGRGLSMKALRSLAQTIDGHKSFELTPVQAWFELERFVVRLSTPQPAETAAASPQSRTMGSSMWIDRHLLDRFKTELGAIVSCSYFGTTMRRSEFEDIVGEVMREKR